MCGCVKQPVCVSCVASYVHVIFTWKEGSLKENRILSEALKYNCSLNQDDFDLYFLSTLSLFEFVAVVQVDGLLGLIGLD